jgi:hypothetical protein
MVNIEQYFDGIFGKNYKNVTLQNINGKNRAVSNNGGDLVVLEPRDTEAEFNYFRKLNDTNIKIIDGDSCSDEYYYSDRYLWVYFNVNPIKVKELINNFTIKINGIDEIFNIDMIRIITDRKTLLQQEQGITEKTIEVKDFTMIGVEISVEYLSDYGCDYTCY